ncbi:hypothetical protein [Corticibacter populi]|uniref:hypothetical protein n=1 Tax=Corticibacter populi TaxID=1550736 RepID=UPI0013C2BA66|nr:hypothetical protein [Corticibacter populi]
MESTAHAAANACAKAAPVNTPGNETDDFLHTQRWGEVDRSRRDIGLPLLFVMNASEAPSGPSGSEMAASSHENLYTIFSRATLLAKRSCTGSKTKQSAQSRIFFQ